MRLQGAGIELSELVGAVCQYLGIDPRELPRLTRQAVVVQGRGLIGYLATREFSIPGSAIARHFHQDRSTVSRAAQRVSQDAELMRAAKKILKRLDSK
jgi:chromosomal replication initiation ATPase DnaA